MGTEKDEKYILYIQWEASLDDQFIYLAAHFKAHNVTLVPVKPKEMDFFLSRSKVPVIMITKTIAQYNQFLSLKKRCFDFYLKAGKIRLIHLNSFREIQDYGAFKPKKSYEVLPLPMKADEVVERILEDYGILEEKGKTWPGGRRSRLPQLGTE